MHVPAFFFRVYIFQVEFERYSISHHLQYPVPITLDFALHVCNSREASIRGLNRCLDVKDAFCSLLQKGHILGSSSLLLLFGDNEGSTHLMGNSNRHLSMDGASAFSFGSSSLLSPSRRTLSEENSLFPSLLTSEDFPDFHFSLHPSISREASGLFTFHDMPSGPSSSHDSADDPRGNSEWLPPYRAHHLLHSSFDEVQEPRRRASSFAPSGFANTPSPLLSHGEVTHLPAVPDASDGFSLHPAAASPEAPSSLSGHSGLNPHSAEFIPQTLLGSSSHPVSGSVVSSVSNPLNNPPVSGSLNNPPVSSSLSNPLNTPLGRLKPGRPTKQASKRDLLVGELTRSNAQEETMLVHRIEENHILTLKLRGLPYSVRTDFTSHA